MDTDFGRAYDPHTKDPVFAKPRLRASDADGRLRNCSAYGAALYTIGTCAGSNGTAAGLFWMACFDGRMLYAACDCREEAVYQEIRRTLIRHF